MYQKCFSQLFLKFQKSSSEIVQLSLGLEPMFFLPEITHLVSGLKVGFLISHCRKNSGKDKVISKKWIYLEKNTECGPSQKARVGDCQFLQGRAIS